MKNFALPFLASLAFLIQCSDDSIESTSTCSTPATVKDLTGLDGCGFVFQLSDGSYLEPYRVFRCGTEPVPKEQELDPLATFEFINGKKVMINFEIIENAGSVCMVGPVARITCISARPVRSEE